MSSKTFLQSMAVLQVALIGGITLFFIIVVSGIVDIGAEAPDKPFSDPLILLAPMVAIGGIMGQLMLHKSRISQMNINNSLASKLMDYRSTYIISWALLEGPALFAMVVSLVTNYKPVLFIYVVMLVMMGRLRPTLEKLLEEVPLTMEEQTKISDPDGIVM